MGKVTAAITAERLCHQGVDLILFIGIAGGIDSSLNLGDVVISTQLAYHDVWCGTPNQKGQVQDLPLYFESSLCCLLSGNIWAICLTSLSQISHPSCGDNNSVYLM